MMEDVPMDAEMSESTEQPGNSKRRHDGEAEDPLAEKKSAYRRFFEEHAQKKRERKELAEKRRLAKLERAQTAKENIQDEPPSSSKGRDWTLAIAVPGSMLKTATSPEMRTYICGQVARAAAIFCVDEVVIYNDDPSEEMNEGGEEEAASKKVTASTRSDILHMARILQYLECPQYLRKYFFPVHDDLKYVGLLNPLDTPHHLRKDEKCWYREGVVLDKKGANRRNKSFVNVGLRTNVLAYDVLEPGVRVTVKFRTLEKMGVPTVDPVPYDTPRKEAGLYWGYDVRIATSFSSVLIQSPHEDGYDLTIAIDAEGDSTRPHSLPPFNHAIMVFSGLHSLETMLEKDDKLQVKDPRDLFDHYIRTPYNLSGINIRTEESLLTSLAAFRPLFMKTSAVSSTS